MIELAAAIGARLHSRADSAAEVAACEVYAGDRVSDLMGQAADKRLLVSNLPGRQLIRVAELMDTAGLCLVDGIVPEPDVIATAERHGTVLMVSPYGLFETCGRAFAALVAQRT